METVVEIKVRHVEPEDYREFHRIFSGSRAIAGTLQLPLPSAEAWRKRLTGPPEGLYSLVACVDGEVVGSLSVETYPSRARRRHVASIGMAVRDDWQGKGVGSALMRAGLDRRQLAQPYESGTERLRGQRSRHCPLQKVRLRGRRYSPPLCFQGRRVRGLLLDGPVAAVNSLIALWREPVRIRALCREDFRMRERVDYAVVSWSGARGTI